MAERGEASASRRPRVEGSAALRLLAIGLALDLVVERIAERPARGFTKDDLLAILADTALLLRERSLLPPAEATFLRRRLLPPAGAFGEAPGVELSRSDLDSLRALAADLVAQYLAEPSDSTESPDPKHVPIQSAALQYAESLLRQEEIIEDLNQASRDDASLHAAVTGSDRTRIDNFLLSKGGTRLDSLTDSWQRFAAYIESRPESFAYEDFENALNRRDMLEDAISLVTPDARRTLESHTGPADERFLQATRAVSASIRPRSPWVPQRWWWYRVPSRQGEYFKDRLEHVAPDVAREVLKETD